MKIMFIIRALSYGGAERQLVTLARGLSLRGNDVSVVTFYEGPLAAELVDSGVRVLTLEKRGRWHLVSFFVRLVKVARRERPDVLHGYLAGGNVLAALLRPFVPRTLVAWGVRASNMDFDRYDWLARVVRRIECALSRSATLIIANSHAGLEHASACGFPRRRMHVIPNGIDAKRFRPEPAAGIECREGWGFASTAPVVGLVGRLDPMKDHMTFLRAASLLALDRPDIRFVCVGDGDPAYRSELERISARSGLDRFLVWDAAHADACAVYNALDVLVSSSAYGEGFSNVVGEAMACGVPCVVTNVGDASLVVGDLDRVVPPADPIALAHAIGCVLDARTPKADTVRRNRGRIVEEFSVERLVERTEACLRAAAGRKVAA